MDNLALPPGANFPHPAQLLHGQSSAPGPLTKCSIPPLYPPNPSHHSAAQWNFSRVNWELSLLRFVSAPRSLHGTSGWNLSVSCNLPQALNVPDGRLVSWLWSTHALDPWLTFRSQQNPIANDNAGYYRVRLGDTPPCWLHYIRTGVTYLVGTWLVAFPPNTWTRFRLTWWSGSNLQGDHALVCRLENWVAGAWVDHGLLYDTNDQHAADPQNAVGLYMRATNDWWDDTQIWRPA